MLNNLEEVENISFNYAKNVNCLIGGFETYENCINFIDEKEMIKLCRHINEELDLNFKNPLNISGFIVDALNFYDKNKWNPEDNKDQYLIDIFNHNEKTEILYTRASINEYIKLLEEMSSLPTILCNYFLDQVFDPIEELIEEIKNLGIDFINNRADSEFVLKSMYAAYSIIDRHLIYGSASEIYSEIDHIFGYDFHAEFEELCDDFDSDYLTSRLEEMEESINNDFRLWFKDEPQWIDDVLAMEIQYYFFVKEEDKKSITISENIASINELEDAISGFVVGRRFECENYIQNLGGISLDIFIEFHRNK